MAIGRFKIGFICGYAVATLRHSKDADPLIQRLKKFEEGFRNARDWWNGLDNENPVRKLLEQGRYAA